MAPRADRGLVNDAEALGDALAARIDEQPIAALLIAAGAGLLLALLTRPSARVVYRRR